MLCFLKIQLGDIHEKHQYNSVVQRYMLQMFLYKCWRERTVRGEIRVREITDTFYLPLKIRLSERRRSLFVLPSVRILLKAGRTGLSAS